MRKTIPIITLLFVIGCASQARNIMQEGRNAGTEYAQARKICDDQKSKKILKNDVEFMDCDNKIFFASFEKQNYPFMDLIKLFTLKRAVLAEQVDNGKITKAEANLEQQEFLMKITDIEKMRLKDINMEDQQENAQIAQAVNDLMQSIEKSRKK